MTNPFFPSLPCTVSPFPAGPPLTDSYKKVKLNIALPGRILTLIEIIYPTTLNPTTISGEIVHAQSGSTTALGEKEKTPDT